MRKIIALLLIFLALNISGQEERKKQSLWKNLDINSIELSPEYFNGFGVIQSPFKFQGFLGDAPGTFGTLVRKYKVDTSFIGANLKFPLFVDDGNELFFEGLYRTGSSIGTAQENIDNFLDSTAFNLADEGLQDADVDISQQIINARFRYNPSWSTRYVSPSITMGAMINQIDQDVTQSFPGGVIPFTKKHEMIDYLGQIGIGAILDMEKTYFDDKLLPALQVDTYLFGGRRTVNEGPLEGFTIGEDFGPGRYSFWRYGARLETSLRLDYIIARRFDMFLQIGLEGEYAVNLYGDVLDFGEQGSVKDDFNWGPFARLGMRLNF